MELKNSTVLRDCLYNLMPDSGANSDYHRGMIVGIASLSVAMGMTLNKALEMIVDHTPVMARHELERAMPECWQGSVKYYDICEICGERKPQGQSCMCFDNHCQ